MNSDRARRLSGQQNAVPGASGCELSWFARWRRSEVSETIDLAPSHGGSRITLAIVLLFSLLSGGLALLPTASDEVATETLAELADAIDPGREAGSDPKCMNCGVVESTREIALVSDRSVKGVEVIVRMKDGARHLFIAADSERSAYWLAGGRVILVDGQSLAGE